LDAQDQWSNASKYCLITSKIRIADTRDRPLWVKRLRKKGKSAAAVRPPALDTAVRIKRRDR
jgi:hypothetical protein